MSRLSFSSSCEGVNLKPLVTFRDFAAADAVEITLQRSQHVEAGLYRPVASIDEAHDLEQAGPAFTAIGRDGRILACCGIYTTFRNDAGDPVQGNIWALLAEGIGAAHLQITRYCRKRLFALPYRRLEAIVKAEDRECTWARLGGLLPMAVLDNWGAASETHILYARLRP